ncbi:MAG: hypothetical protein Q9168_000419 [Polycauliona sp. 1 TL-2023]
MPTTRCHESQPSSTIAQDICSRAQQRFSAFFHGQSVLTRQRYKSPVVTSKTSHIVGSIASAEVVDLRRGHELPRSHQSTQSLIDPISSPISVPGSPPREDLWHYRGASFRPVPTLAPSAGYERTRGSHARISIVTRAEQYSFPQHRREKRRHLKSSGFGRVRYKAVGSLVSGTLLALLLAIYLALAISKAGRGQAFHVVFIVFILVLTMIFCHFLIRLSMLSHHLRIRGERQIQLAPVTPSDEECAQPQTPIPIILARDEELGLNDTGSDVESSVKVKRLIWLNTLLCARPATTRESLRQLQSRGQAEDNDEKEVRIDEEQCKPRDTVRASMYNQKAKRAKEEKRTEEVGTAVHIGFGSAGKTSGANILIAPNIHQVIHRVGRADKMVPDPAPSHHMPSEVSGYRILPLSLPPLPSYPVSATHYLYLRPHEPKLPTPAAARSLFLANVPFDSTELHIKRLLSAQIGLPPGRIEDVQFEGTKRKTEGLAVVVAHPKNERKVKKRKMSDEHGGIEDLDGTALPVIWDRELRTDGRTAVVVFVDRLSMEAAYKSVKRVARDGPMPIWGEGTEGKVPSLGLPRYLRHSELQYPDRNQVLEAVNAYMTEFAAREAAQVRLQTRKRQVPDEDGFITVTKGGRTGPARQDAAQELALKHKQKQKGLEDFYRFQTRDKKKAKAVELMRKFEGDKQKVQRMRERRGMFRPE